MNKTLKAGVSLATVTFVIAALLGLLWYMAPRIAESLLARELPGYGWKLQLLDLPRQVRFPLHVSKVIAVNQDITATLSGLTVTPLSANTFTIAIDDAHIADNTIASSLTGRDIVEILDDLVPSFLPTGDIRHFAWCAPVCIDAEVHWRKSGTQLNVDSRLHNLPVPGDVTVDVVLDPGRARVSAFGAQGMRYFADGALQWNADTLTFITAFHLDAQGAPVKIRGKAPLNYLVQLNRLNVTGNGSIPLAVPARLDALQQAQFSYNVSGDANWSAQGDQLLVTGLQHIDVSGNYGAHQAVLQLGSPLTTEVRLSDKIQTSITASAGTTCGMKESRFDCTFQDLRAFGITLGLDAMANTASNTGHAHITWHGSASDLAPLLQRFDISALRLPAGTADIKMDADLDLSAHDPGHAVTAFSADVASYDAAATWAEYAFQGINARIRLAGWPHISARAASVSIDKANVGVPITKLSATFDVDIDANAPAFVVTGKSLSATVLGGKLASHDFAFDSGPQAGHAALDWHGDVTGLAPVVQRLDIKGLALLAGTADVTDAAGFNLAAGDLAHRVTDFSADLSANNVVVTWNELAFQGANVSMTLAGWPHVQSLKPATLGINEVNVGVPVKNVSATFDVDANAVASSYTLKGRTLSASTLGGTLSSHDFAFDLGTQSGHALVDVNALDLSQLLALEKEELESTGLISGSVPVQITNGNLSVDKGKVSAEAPGGVIRYKPSGSLESMVGKNAQMKLVVDSMSDFHYHTLSADIDYTPQGKLTAHTTLYGSNPQYQGGREIHFNLQLEENVGTLLKSLRLDNEVTRRIEETVRKAGEGSQGAKQ